MSYHPVAVLIYEIIQGLRAQHPERPALVGVGGAQGSGKSYHCRMLTLSNQPRYAHFSLDDVYWPPNQREHLAKRMHPLFVTRGPPATHDTNRARRVIGELMDAAPDTQTLIPRYDKLADEDVPYDQWPVFTGRPEAILIDGWCMGALTPEDMTGKALNPIEQTDSDGAWRRTQAMFLDSDYAQLFDQFDAMIYLQAPSWEIVRSWRGQQEEQALGRPLNGAENAALDRFVMHYERITRSMLAGHHRAKWIVHLDETRNVQRIEER